MNSVLCRSGLLASCIQPSDRSASNHLLPSPGLGLVLTRSLPHGLPTVSLSGPWRRLGFTIHWRLATATSRIEFVILRTSLSPPVALHPLSRGRSYCQLRNSNQIPTRTSTLLIRYTCKRTTGGARRADYSAGNGTVGLATEDPQAPGPTPRHLRPPPVTCGLPEIPRK
jgi:hypothetical protein